MGVRPFNLVAGVGSHGGVGQGGIVFRAVLDGATVQGQLVGADGDTDGIDIVRRHPIAEDHHSAVGTAIVRGLGCTVEVKLQLRRACDDDVLVESHRDLNGVVLDVGVVIAGIRRDGNLRNGWRGLIGGLEGSLNLVIRVVTRGEYHPAGVGLVGYLSSGGLDVLLRG